MCVRLHALLTQGGAVKQYKGLECPLDGFELVLFSLSGAVGGAWPHTQLWLIMSNCFQDTQPWSVCSLCVVQTECSMWPKHGSLLCCITQDGKTYPLCPLCYNYPPFEGVAKVRMYVIVWCVLLPHM